MLGRRKKEAGSQNEQPKACESKSIDPLRRLDLLDDEDVCVMLQGSKMVKVRSSRWQKDRIFRLLEDCVTVWCESSKTSHKAKRRQTSIRSCGRKVSGAGCGGNPQTQWWTLEVRDAVKLKKESYRAWLARGTPEAAEAYRQAKRMAAGVVSEAETRVWEEFGEAMEKDYRTASGKFWQTVRCLRRGKQLSANTVYSGGGELLASTGDIVGWWKEYFEDLLNPTDTPSVEEPEAEDSEVDSFITQAEVTEVVQQLLGGKAPGVDEIRPEYLKVLEGSWEFAQPVHMCFVDLEKAFDCVPHGILWEVLWEYGVRGLLLRAVWSLYNQSRSLVRIASCKTDLFPVHVRLRQGCPLSPVLFIVFMDRISRRSQGLEGVRFGDHRISSLIFADDVVLLAPSSLDLQHALGRFAAECEVAGIRVNTSKFEAMVLDRKKVACTLQVGGELLPQMEEFKYLGVLFTSEGRMDREIDRLISAAAAVMRSMYWSVVVKEELSWKAKLSIYQSIYVPTLTYGHELWVMTERIRSRIQEAEMSFLRRVVGRSLRDRVRSSVTREELGVQPLFLHIERGQLRWLGHLFRMPPGRLPGEVFWACPGRGPGEDPGHAGETMSLGWPGNASGSFRKSWRKCLGRGRKQCISLLQHTEISLTSDTWIRSYLRRADLNQDGKMSYDEVQHLLQMINIDLNEQYARTLFKKCDRSHDNRLDPVEIEEFCRELMRRPELDAVFRHYSSNGCVLSTLELRDFLGDQGEGATLGHAQKLIHTYEFNDWAQKNLFMTQNGFTMYMLSNENDVFNPDHTSVYQDMTRPLAHYYISSSHNTYLTKDQVTGESSTEPYIRALNQGCRCVELDCWDGDKGEPVIYHGHTLTSKVAFKEVIETIAQYAFKVSPYPLILSLENHCSVEQQAVMAQHLRSILGSALLSKPLSDQTLNQLPSPEELKGRMLVKARKLTGQLEKLGSSASFSSISDEEIGGSNKSPSKKESGKPVSSSKISPELSELVVYCRSVTFPGFDAASQRPTSEMSSFSENEALKQIKDSGNLFVRHNSRQLSRVYPSGQRLQSSNYDPQDMWNVGCQMVALNFQTPGEQMDLNRGRFLPNGRCGYVLKPDFLCQPNSNFNPENTGGGPGHIPTQLTIRVISAQQLPKINTDKRNSIVDPQVWVEIHGVSIDKARAKTHRINNNGFNPRWDCTLSFQLQVPELALVRFVVEDHDHTSKNDFVGQFTLPFNSLRTGYRHIHLLKADGSSLSPATLFIHVKVTRRGVPIKTVSERMGKV
ncbi:hypothetical protein QTP70_017925 [Hemibagrus guttatus]|uniref:Phosphoinositide phospholipase C n=1 Tax=Hemibagrus guttatus TaxID=175788 RepID=A0AAE0UWB5_9TELE|nr:hypothetical protein QTP70_017925 [Hemibagrus guttatus]